MKIQYDKWQQEILDYNGDIMLLKGRRIGATEIFSIKAAIRMVEQPGVKIVFVSLTEDTAKLCISVAIEYLTRHHKKLIKKEQLGVIELKTGSNMKVRAVGNTGRSIRGFDGDVLGVDEAPWQPKLMWRAARPIIATNDGEIWMWGTPDVDEGYFYEQWVKAYINKNPNARFKAWYKNTEEVLAERPISPSWTQKKQDGLRRILTDEKEDMNEDDYANEYLGQFLSNLRRIFSDEWIEKVFTIQENATPPHGELKALGVDIAGMGDDDSTFEGLSKSGDHITQFYHETTRKTRTTDTTDKILSLQSQHAYDFIGVDSGGMGVGVFDQLLIDDLTRNEVVGLNNAKKVIDKEGRTTKLLKEDMYETTLAKGERGELHLFDNEDMKRSFRSIHRGENGRISGRWAHIAEGVIRGVELLKYKDLNLKIYTIKV